MTLRPIGWICGEMVRKFAGQAEMIQRAFLEIIDEIRDEFPNLLRLTSSNQQRDRTVKESGTVMGRVFSSPHGVIIRNGLTKISRSSKSIATFIQPQLAKKLAELNMLTRRLLNTLNGPKKPLLRVKAISINKILGKIKSLVETQKPSRRNSSDNVDADGFPRGNETASVPIQQESSDFIMKAPKNGESIKTLLSSMDQEN
ncbi:spermatogenesis-associated protein 9 isoform X2 [Anolis carolinensis]|uniref:spermatogenesis-associated protein 9 isoform X2 n=1 Tax=Anolis carolinensis TaxID=28377 RepID=UPI002F2B6DD6